jgi:hypothetical protein
MRKGLARREALHFTLKGPVANPQQNDLNEVLSYVTHAPYELIV